MKTKQRIALLFTFGIAPLLSFSQEKTSQEKNNTKFKFEKLSEEKNGTVDFKKNYDLGSQHYNKGVDIIKTGKEDITLAELAAIQDSSIEQIKLAIPYLIKAHELSPTDKNTLEGLVGSYIIIADNKKSAEYQKALDLLNKK